jgi:hypothetical protein
VQTGPQAIIDPGAPGQGQKRAAAAQAFRSLGFRDASAPILVELCWQIGTTVLFMVAAVSGLAAILLICGGSLGSIGASAILIAAVALAVMVPRATVRQHWRIVAASSLAIAALAIATSLLIYDTSVDGQNYHFQAINGLVHGWNPYWSAVAPPGLGDWTAPWVLHYPKAAWLFGATLVSVGLPLEATKAINIMALAAAALMLAGALGRLGLSWLAVAALTAAAALNPITGVQLFTRMNDGLIASCVLSFVVAVVVWVASGDRKAFAAAAASMMFALNLKFSAIPLFAFFCAATVAAVFMLKGWKDARSVALHLFAAGLVGLVVFGWAPYVMNLMHFGHPLYPLMGAGAADIMKINTPDILVGLSKSGRFLFSVFATTHNGYETLPHLKLPLTMSLAELRANGAAPDIRIGGFGSLFSAVVVAAIAVVALLLALRERTAYFWWLLYVGAVLLLSVFAMPENWWARYVPQLWLVPGIVALLALTAKGRGLRAVGWAVVLLMLSNTVLVTSAATALAFKRSQAVREQIAVLKRDPGPYCVATDFAQSRVALMREAGIDARQVPEKPVLTCAAPQPIAAFGPDRRGGRICPCDGD